MIFQIVLRNQRLIRPYILSLSNQIMNMNANACTSSSVEPRKAHVENQIDVQTDCSPVYGIFSWIGIYKWELYRGDDHKQSVKLCREFCGFMRSDQ